MSRKDASTPMYYRVKDPHGNVSNPTVVHEIELLDTGNGVYPSVKTFELPTMEKAKTKPNKSFKKYILIRPNYLQDSVVDVGPKTGIPLEEMWPTAQEGSQNLKIGLLDKTIFSRKFKVRITSKRTGKKIDINFDAKSVERESKSNEEKC